MNNSDLKKKLKAARELVLAEDYQTDFSRQVLTNLRSAPPEQISARNVWRPRLVWGFAATILILAAFGLGHWRGRVEVAGSSGILENGKLIRETLALFPNQVRAIVQDEHGLKLELAELADVPDSPPLFVRICDGENCFSAVTFSGQEISVAGKKITVLAAADGGIILMGEQFAWSSSAPSATRTGLQIKAKAL